MKAMRWFISVLFLLALCAGPQLAEAKLKPIALAAGQQQAIAKINARLSSLADDEVLTVADMLDHIADAQTGIRRLTPRELQLIEQSKADFQDGRTSTLQESRAFVEAELAHRRAARSA